MSHPRDVLLGAQAGGVQLPVCDHYSGVQSRMRKSLQLQAEMTQEFGACVFDVTLDCEDGAPVGGEAEHAALVTELALGAATDARVGVRVHPVDHPSFLADMATIAGQAAHRLTHIMVPKVESVADVQLAEQALLQAGASDLPLHVLIESPAAVHRAFDIAAHPRVPSISASMCGSGSTAEAQIDQASEIILAAQAADWAPISHAGQLHDRASYRFFWRLIERAHQTGRALPPQVRALFHPFAVKQERP